jgi:hypothetical protein
MSNMNEYALLGSRSDLQKHVNKRVEVRGTLEPSSGSASGMGTGTGTGTSTTTSGTTTSGAGMQRDISTLPRLRVSSVREVGDSCSSSDIK